MLEVDEAVVDADRRRRPSRSSSARSKATTSIGSLEVRACTAMSTSAEAV